MASSTVIPQMGSLVTGFDSFMVMIRFGYGHCALSALVVLFPGIHSGDSTGHGLRMNGLRAFERHGASKGVESAAQEGAQEFNSDERGRG